MLWIDTVVGGRFAGILGGEGGLIRELPVFRYLYTFIIYITVLVDILIICYLLFIYFLKFIKIFFCIFFCMCYKYYQMVCLFVDF